MRLDSGYRLGPYEIVAPLGAGVQGEVYRARDTRLGRTVAVKVLPPDVAGRPEARQRFEREARAISSLNHAHICALYDVGQHEGVDFLVMEYLEGETLAKRLERGPFSIDQVLHYGAQIARALAHAHGQGVLHRDLKTRNVMLTRSGAKLLDFGLAKFWLPEPSAEAGGESVSQETLTAEGRVVGTLFYMSPEQLEGKAVDARTDIFALGAVLYEMTTGERAFQGDTAPALSAAILFGRAPSLPEKIMVEPAGAALEHLIQKCLAKHLDDRWQSSRDLAAELQWVHETSGGASAFAARQGVGRRPRSLARAWPYAAMALLAAAAVGSLFIRSAPPDRRPVHFLVSPPEASRLVGSVAVSPDGAQLAFIATAPGGTTWLWIRGIDSLAAGKLPGTEGALHPFWSPDNRFLGFFAEGKLKKIRVEGGPPQALASVFDARGGTWNREGVIVFSPNVGDRLYRIRDDGSGLAPVTSLDSSESSHQWPQFLPDGRRFIYLVWSAKVEARGIYLGSLGSPERRHLVPADWGAVYALGPRGKGYLLFLRGRTLLAQSFDASGLGLEGEPSPIADEVWYDETVPGLTSFSASGNGVLAYRTGGVRTTRLVWYDREGRSLGAVGPPGAYRDPCLSPDGKRFVVSRIDSETGTQDLWIFESTRGVTSRFTFHPANEATPLWSPDGARIVFASDRERVPDLYQKISTGVAAEEALLRSKVSKYATGWSRDKPYLVYASWDAKTKWDLWTLPMAGERQPSLYVQSEFDEFQAHLSTDGRFVAYTSNESGVYEVYVQPFPASGAKWQVSTSGGAQPRWGGDGRELFYLAADLKLMAVKVESSGGFDPGIPRALFQTEVTGLVDARNHYEVSSDGQRFLVSTVQEPASSSMGVVINWPAKLGR